MEIESYPKQGAWVASTNPLNAGSGIGIVQQVRGGIRRNMHLIISVENRPVRQIIAIGTRTDHRTVLAHGIPVDEAVGVEPRVTIPVGARDGNLNEFLLG